MHRFWTVYPNERSNIFEFEASEVIQTHDVMMRTIDQAINEYDRWKVAFGYVESTDVEIETTTED